MGMKTGVDSSHWAKQCSDHLDRWMAGKEQFIAPSEFIGQKLAEALLDQYLAEQGVLLA